MLSRLTATTTLNDLKHLDVEKPTDAGTHWRPLDFAALLVAVRQRAKERDWLLHDWAIHLSRHDADLSASAPLTYKPYPFKGADLYRPAIGLTASNARKKSLRFYTGCVPLDGDTAVVMDMTPAGHKHTIRFDLKEAISEAFSRWTEFVSSKMYKAVVKLRSDKLEPADTERLLHAAGRAGLMPWSRIGRVDEAWRQGNKRTAWALALAFGHVAALNTPTTHMDRLLGFYRLLTGQPAAGVAD